MVTKVSQYAGNLALSKNFEPTGIAGLVVTHSGGALTGPGVIKETVSGNVTIPDNVAWSVYASLLTGLLVASATSAVPTTNALVLWEGVSSGGTITNFSDRRSWASTAKFTTALQGFNEYLTTNFNLNHDWKFETNNTTQPDDGTASTSHDLSAGGSGITFDVTGDVSYEADDAIRLDGTTNSTLRKSTGAQLNTINSGTFGIVFKTTEVDDLVFLFAYGGASNPDFTAVFKNAQNSFRYNMRDSGSDDVIVQSNTTPDFEDGNYHMAIVVQPGDSTGIKLYVDGALQTLITETYQGIFDNNAWWPESTGAGKIAIGSTVESTLNELGGDVSRCWISDDAFTAAEIAKLQLARTAAVDPD